MRFINLYEKKHNIVLCNMCEFKNIQNKKYLHPKSCLIWSNSTIRS